jgi:hypothetical protein
MMSVFNTDDLDKYSHQYDLKHIYQELHSIFIRLADFEQLRAYTMYLMRAQLRGDWETDVPHILNNKYGQTLLLLDKVPDLKTLEAKLVQQPAVTPITMIVFKTRPDNETLEYLQGQKIEYLFTEELGRTQVNMNNGELIHWFIRARLSALRPQKEKVDVAEGCDYSNA